MDRRKDILHHLDENQVPYTIIEHEPKLTIEDCLKTPQLDLTRATMPKNVFLTNRQQTDFYLLLLSPDKPFQTSVVSKLLHVSRLSFATKEHLAALLKADAGAVSPLNLIFDQERAVHLVIDQGLLQMPQLWFHPGNNTSSLELSTKDFLHRFLPALQITPTILTIPTLQGEP